MHCTLFHVYLIGHCISHLSAQLQQTILDVGHTLDKQNYRKVSFKQQFVQPLLVEDGETGVSTTKDDKPDEYQASLQKSPANTTYKDILPVNTTGLTVLLCGRAGVGKTTLVQWLLTQWALNMWAVHCCCAFMLNLRYLMANEYTISLPDLFTTCSLYAVGKTLAPLKEWMSNCEEQLVVLLGRQPR